MRILMNISRLLIVGIATATLPAAATTLATPLLAGNGQNGIMFDVAVGSRALTLASFAVALADGDDLNFYVLAGGIGAQMSNAAAWTLHDSFTSVAIGGVLTSFDVRDFTLAADTVYGFYITTSNGSIEYSDGTAVGSIVAGNADLSILSGYGKAYAFGQSSSPRDFNGSLTYAHGAVPEPMSWALMAAGFGIVGGALRRRETFASA